MKHFIITTLLFAFISTLHAQLSFKRTYGTGAAQSVSQCSDNGYIVSGIRTGVNDTVFLMKTNVTGIPEWVHVYPGIPASLATVVITSTGYLMAVYDDSTYLIATDAQGQVTAARRIPGYIRAMKVFSDGTIVATGLTSPTANGFDLLVTRLDNQGNQIWYRQYDQPGNSAQGHGVCEAENGNILIAGYARTSPNLNSALMLKLSSTGDIVRQKILTTSTNNIFYSAETNGNAYVFAGYGYNNSNSNPPFAMLMTKTDTLFSISSTTYKDAPTCGEMMDVITTDEGFSFLIEPEGAGYFGKRSGILRTDYNLNTQWEKLYDRATAPEFGSYPWDFTLCSDSGYAIAGESYLYNAYNANITLTKVDKFGNLACGDTITAFPLTACNFTVTTTLIAANSNPWSLPVSVMVDSIPASDSLLCMSNPGNVSIAEHATTINVFLLSTLVNDDLVVMPRGTAARHEYEIINAAGACVQKGRLNHEQEINVSALAPGIYFLYLDQCNTMKFVKQ